MSYVIRYGGEPKPAREENRRRKFNITATVLAMLTVITAFALPQSREFLQRLLFPWLDDGLVTSFGEMLSGIRQGEAVSAAFLEFCREVIGRARIPV